MRSSVGAITLMSLAFTAACVSDRTEEADEATATAEPAATDCGGGASNEVVFSTSMGDITLELYPEQAPITVENFLAYVESCFYDGTIIHRVAPGFVIQGGGFTPEMQRKATRPPIQNEADNGLKNVRGSLSMARTVAVNGATSQFFINVADNEVLDHGVRDFGYAVFARVTEGMDVVDEIAAVRTGAGSETPIEPVVIRSARRK
jgi:peptidyl-prolyl cis-trans isomerase A (cyclophilin A)